MGAALPQLCDSLPVVDAHPAPCEAGKEGTAQLHSEPGKALMRSCIDTYLEFIQPNAMIVNGKHIVADIVSHLVVRAGLIVGVCISRTAETSPMHAGHCMQQTHMNSLQQTHMNSACKSSYQTHMNSSLCLRLLSLQARAKSHATIATSFAGESITVHLFEQHSGDVLFLLPAPHPCTFGYHWGSSNRLVMGRQIAAVELFAAGLLGLPITDQVQGKKLLCIVIDAQRRQC